MEILNLSWKLKMYRMKNRYTQKQLSEKSGVSSATIFLAEKRQNYNLRLENAIKLAASLNITLEQLVVENQ